MKPVLLFHWNADEAKERLERLRRAGFPAIHYADAVGPGLRTLRDDPPRAVVIDLDRIPSQGRAVAVFLRRQKGTREVPIVFVGGEPENAAKARSLLPDAVFAEWRGIRDALRRAIGRPPARRAVPGTFDEYARTPLATKLGFRPGPIAALIGAPPGFADTLGALPEGVRLKTVARGPADLVLLFARSKADLAARFTPAARALADGGALWLIWPKQASGVKSDLAHPIVQAFGLARGLVDYKIAAIDATWSGLKFARSGGGRCAKAAAGRPAAPVRRKR